MPSSPSTRLRLEKQAAGEHSNTWGTVLNTDLDLLEAAIAGRTAVTVSGPVTLSTTNYAADQSRAVFLDLSGTGGTVTIPAVEKTYLVRNGGSGDMVLTTGGGTTATVKVGNLQWVASDATNVYRAQERDLGSDQLSTSADPSTANHLARKAYVDAGDATNASAITSGDAATLVSSKAYTDATAFAAGSLPGGGSVGQVLRRIAGPSADWHTIDSTDFNTAAPAQAGNARKLLTTDGANVSWATVAGAASMLFSDGADGNVTIGSGTTTLARDMHYANLTISGTGKLNTAGYRVFVSGTLDVSAAGAQAIYNNATSAGGNAANATNSGSWAAAGTAGAGAPGVSFGAGGAGAVGGQSNQNTGTAGNNGGASGAGGASGVITGGSAAIPSAGNRGTLPSVAGTYYPLRNLRPLLTILDSSTTLIAGGSGGSGGSGGVWENSNTFAGGAGGGGGGGGGVVQLFARYINRGASTAVAAIQAIGTSGGNGGNGYLNQSGGGGGGNGGGGGWVIIACESLLGATATNAIDVSGGGGGSGGGNTATTGGAAGGGYGASGRVTIYTLGTATFSDTGVGAAGTGTAGSANTGGAAQAAPTTRYSL